MIKVAIVGYGNLGKGVNYAIENAPDIECVGIFTKRKPETIMPVIKTNVYGINRLLDFKDEIDVLILCGGSATDLPQTTAKFLKDFNTVDSFDTHAKIPEYYDELNKVAKTNNKTCAISIGWDPGLFSIARLIFSSVLPDGNDYTFWGKGVSQGHSDAIRRIEGVKKAIQYTIPKEQALSKVRSGERAELGVRDKHLRECFVVVQNGANLTEIENKIKTMPNYFSDYDTIVHFISDKEFDEKHTRLSHGGFVIRTGNTTQENNSTLEFSLKLDSNPEFTGSVLLSYARAIYRLSKENKIGAYTVFDIPLRYLSTLSEKELRETML